MRMDLGSSCCLSRGRLLSCCLFAVGVLSMLWVSLGCPLTLLIASSGCPVSLLLVTWYCLLPGRLPLSCLRDVAYRLGGCELADCHLLTVGIGQRTHRDNL